MIRKILDDISKVKQQLSKTESRHQKAINSVVNSVKQSEQYCNANENVNTPQWSDMKNMENRYDNVQQNILNELLIVQDKIKVIDRKLLSNDDIMMSSLNEKIMLLENDLKSVTRNVNNKTANDEVQVKITNIENILKSVTNNITNMKPVIEEFRKSTVQSAISNNIPKISNNTRIDNGTNINNVRQTEGNSVRSNDVNTLSYKTKLLICIDSNRKYLQPRKLWTTNGTTWKHSSRLSFIPGILDDQSLDLSNLEAILINTGVNDIDYMRGAEVHKILLSTINTITRKFPHIKIVVSEITPRNDEKDSEVVICNRMLADSVLMMNNVILIKHDNLRDGNWSYFQDVKHIRKESVHYFAGNIKSALRIAFNNDTRYRNVLSKSIHHPIAHADLRVDQQRIDDYPEGRSSINPKFEVINRVIDALKGILM